MKIVTVHQCLLLGLMLFISWLQHSGCQDPAPTDHSNETTSNPLPTDPNASDKNKWERSLIKKFLIFGGVVCALVIGFFLVRYCRSEKKKTIFKRYSRLSTGNTGAPEEDEEEEIELSIYEKQ